MILRLSSKLCSAVLSSAEDGFYRALERTPLTLRPVRLFDMILFNHQLEDLPLVRSCLMCIWITIEKIGELSSIVNQLSRKITSAPVESQEAIQNLESVCKGVLCRTSNPPSRFLAKEQQALVGNTVHICLRDTSCNPFAIFRLPSCRCM